MGGRAFGARIWGWREFGCELRDPRVACDARVALQGCVCGGDSGILQLQLGVIMLANQAVEGGPRMNVRREGGCRDLAR